MVEFAATLNTARNEAQFLRALDTQARNGTLPTHASEISGKAIGLFANRSMSASGLEQVADKIDAIGRNTGGESSPLLGWSLTARGLRAYSRNPGGD